MKMVRSIGTCNLSLRPFEEVSPRDFLVSFGSLLLQTTRTLLLVLIWSMHCIRGICIAFSSQSRLLLFSVQWGRILDPLRSWQHCPWGLSCCRRRSWLLLARRPRFQGTTECWGVYLFAGIGEGGWLNDWKSYEEDISARIGKWPQPAKLLLTCSIP